MSDPKKSIWDEIKNLPDLKPYVYGLKKEYDNKVNELEKQNEEMIKFLIDDYITCKDGQHPRHRDLKIYLEQITGKSIEEVLKDYE